MSVRIYLESTSHLDIGHIRSAYLPVRTVTRFTMGAPTNSTILFEIRFSSRASPLLCASTYRYQSEEQSYIKRHIIQKVQRSYDEVLEYEAARKSPVSVSTDIDLALIHRHVCSTRSEIIGTHVPSYR